MRIGVEVEGYLELVNWVFRRITNGGRIHLGPLHIRSQSLPYNLG